ncbi:MAG: hypothetical protein WCY84_02800 [Candidatus Cloacimonadaceae bacterium]
MKLPDKFIIDTNIPLTANKIFNNPKNEKDWMQCAYNCIELLETVVKSKQGLVLDAGDEIFREYGHKLSYKGQPGVGDKFFKWLHDNRYSFPTEDRVEITPQGDTYKEFPDHPGLKDFDISDRKFIAVAYSHSAKPKPTIFEATDSKWIGWRKALSEVGIEVNLLCEEYVKSIYKKKFPNRKDV